MKLILLIPYYFLITQLAQAQGSVKMLKSNCQPIVSSKLNGKKAFFLVDTGSDVSILNLKDAKKYGLKIRKMDSRSYKLSGLDSEQRDIWICRNVDLQLGDNSTIGTYSSWLIYHIFVKRSMLTPE